MYVCLHVLMYVCLHVRMYVFMYVCLHVCIQTVLIEEEMGRVSITTTMVLWMSPHHLDRWFGLGRPSSWSENPSASCTRAAVRCRRCAALAGSTLWPAASQHHNHQNRYYCGKQSSSGGGGGRPGGSTSWLCRSGES